MLITRSLRLLRSSRSRRRQVAGIVTSLAVSLPLAACGASNADGQSGHVRAAYIPSATWLPAWVAQDQGFFADHGLEVDLTAVQNISTLPPLVGKQYDIVPATPPELFKAAAQGIDVEAVAGGTIATEEHPIGALYVGKDVTDVGSLDGARIGTVSVGAALHLATLALLDKNGVDSGGIDAVELPFPTMPDQLKAGKVDAVEAVEPFSKALGAAGYTDLGDPISALGDGTASTLWLSSDAWVSDHADEVAGWRKALDDAIRWIDENPDEARGIVGKYTDLPAEVYEALSLYSFTATIDEDQLAPWNSVMTDYAGLSDADVDVVDLVAGEVK